MHRKLTADQIRDVCKGMLLRSNHPSVNSVVAELRQRYGASGRRERVAEILRGLIGQQEPRQYAVESSDLASLRQQLFEAQQRAARAEELERRHQDFWAARYQEKLAELQYRVVAPSSTGVSSEQYLRLYQRAAELASRLARYEEVEPLRVLHPQE